MEVSLLQHQLTEREGDNLMAYKHNGQSRTTMTLIDSINNARGLGAGEILLSSIDNDGSVDI